MKRSFLAGSVAACLCFGPAVPLLAAQPLASTAIADSSSSGKDVSTGKPAEKCLTDLRAFETQMVKDGYWLGGSGYGYGYPVGGYGYGYPMSGYATTTGMPYQSARPGYEVRALVAAANILARHGQLRACEDTLATTHNIYNLYVADMHSGRVPVMDVPGWRQLQIAAAQPVTSKNTSFRSDELLGTEVRDPQNEALGSVDDLVMSPQTGQIAYLVIARGGIFGFDEKYVPVPWGDFMVTPNMNLLVLNTTKGVMEAAPQVSHSQFTSHFDQQSQKVDAYWKMHIIKKMNDASSG